MIRRLRREEGGWALVTAIGLLSICMAFAMATLAQVDTQQRESGVSRTKETAFNAAEAALSAQTFTLAQGWPGSAAKAYPVCTQASTDPRCPSTQALQTATSSPDALQGFSWRTEVRDNRAPDTINFYDDTLTQGAAPYDDNKDGRVWVRAQARVGSRTRTLVALVRVEEQPEPMPRAAVISGRLEISNKGNKAIVDGSVSSDPTVQVRCTVQLLDLNPCLGHSLLDGATSTLAALFGLLDSQLKPNVAVQGYAGGDAVTADARARLEKTAQADGTWYATCPTSLPAGRLVWIESGNCTYEANAVVNSESAPGMIVLDNDATLTLNGTLDYHGIIYAPNPNNLTSDRVRVHGNARVFGGVLIDGQGQLEAGSSKVNVTLRLGAYDRVRSYASAGMIQNTWREIVPAS
ncbi:MAG TPA: hypothetical protein VD931_20655 [Baekduia sp.]|nr:hypothetical protein [Baekduia sp.]